jgi:hypothetical protein
MQRLQSRTYVGKPRETVSLQTTVGGGGQVRITVGGQPVAGGQFQLPGTAGATARMQIALAGPQGASCVVGISVVDGGSDTDFLLCSVFNPLPVSFYDFSVAPAAVLTTLADAKETPPPATRGRGAAPKPPTAPKRAAKRTAKPRATRPSRRGK